MQTMLNLQPGKTIELTKLPLEQIDISIFNPRCIRPDDVISELAESMQLNGYDPLKPVRVHETDGRYAVFVGGNRFLAAQKANINPIPAAIYKGYQEGEIWRLAYVDNEEEGKHRNLTPYDIWADYAKHYNNGKTQTEIARILGVQQPIVSYRLKLFDFTEQCPQIREFICQGRVTEEHLRFVITLYVDIYLADWLVTSGLWLNIAKRACNMTTRETKEAVDQWKEVIKTASDYYDKLSESGIRYGDATDANGEGICIETYDPKADFVQRLSEKKPDTKRKVQNIISQIEKEHLESLREYEAFLKRRSNQIETERQRQEEEERKRQEREFFYPKIFCLSSENMDGEFTDIDDAVHIIPDDSVHLVITSPPYNIGREYDQHDDKMAWDDYKESLLKPVFEQCYKKLVVGGRIAVNVPNVACQEGEKPIFILLDIFNILTKCGFEDREIITWVKAAAEPKASVAFCIDENFQGRMDALAFDTTAWGSWQSPSNPFMRSLSEFIIVMHKQSPQLVGDTETDLTEKEFMNWTRNVWFIAPTSSSLHPAIFPEELPKRLIKLYSYPKQIVLDPFMGIGTTGIAAVKNNRRFIGFDISRRYTEIALTSITDRQNGK